jgi:hypothetical protein
MRLADLRRFSIRKQFKIHFRLQNGMECVVSDRGIAEVPALKGPPAFNLEDELASAKEFLLEPAAAPDKKNPVKPLSVTRDQLAGMVSASPTSGAAPDRDDE